MRFLLDEHFSYHLAERLRALGHDAVSVAERVDLRTRPDDRLWKSAALERRVLVTQDLGDFSQLVATGFARGEGHAGLVLVPVRAFPRTLDGTGRLAAALDRLAAASPHGLADRVVWLEEPPEG